MKQDTTSLFETIVKTLLSSQTVSPIIIQEHISRYASAAGITYTLARQAVTATATLRLQQKIEEL